MMNAWQLIMDIHVANSGDKSGHPHGLILLLATAGGPNAHDGECLKNELKERCRFGTSRDQAATHASMSVRMLFGIPGSSQ